jgi:predicted NAD/FAD-binding protein
MSTVKNSSGQRIGVVGGGIAGVSAAWALTRSGFRVSLFEKCSALGGNAKTFRWPLRRGAVESPLLVVAWPEAYYHNYGQLLRELGIPWTTIPIKYFVRNPDGVFRQDGSSDLDRRLEGDLRRWSALVKWATRVNALFNGKWRHNGLSEQYRSLYDFSYFNPLNFLPLHRALRLVGVSEDFWRKVFVPLHSSTFITTKLDGLPAVIAPLLEDVVPLERPCTMATWQGSPREVFDRMTEGFLSDVHLNHQIAHVRALGSGFEISDVEGRSFAVDKVVFACDARSIMEVLAQPSWLQKALLSRVKYVDDDDQTFLEGVVHNDVTVLPEEHREQISTDYNTYTDVRSDGTMESTFVLSSHLPYLKGKGQQMFVTFNSRRPINHVRAHIRLPRCNHVLTMKNLAIMSLLRRLQGKGNMYYCGGFTTPEGGHDLSFLSGLVVAHDLGAPYPLDQRNEAAVADFYQLQKLMLGRKTSLEGPTTATVIPRPAIQATA